MKNTNMNPKTGIRYGIISANGIDSDFLAEFEGVPPELHCSSCGEVLTDIYCDNCGTENFEFEYQEAEYSKYDRNGVYAEHNHNTTDVTVFHSPSVFKTRLCSPCFPNAGDLSTKGGYKTYGIPAKYLSKNFRRI